MTIDNEPFIALELDFSGKDSAEERARYLRLYASITEEEYQKEIAGRNVEFFYERMSSVNCFMITKDDMNDFEFSIQIRKSIRKKRLTENKLRKAS